MAQMYRKVDMGQNEANRESGQPNEGSGHAAKEEIIDCLDRLFAGASQLS